jgi:Skp family chaperone for outer membrane proteins
MRTTLSLLLTLLAAPLTISAQTNAGGGTRVAFVNSTEVLQGTAEGRQALADLEKLFNQKQSELATRQTELDTLRREYDSKFRMLNPETLAEMQRAITEKDRQLTRAREDVEAEVSQRQNDLLARMSEKIQAVIAEYAERNGIGVVFLEAPSLPYFAEKLDITAEIIKAYDAKHPAAAAAAGAPKP